MVVVTNIFDRDDKYFSIDLSLDSLVHCIFRIMYSTIHFSLYTPVYLVLDTVVRHGLTKRWKSSGRKNREFNPRAKTNQKRLWIVMSAFEVCESTYLPVYRTHYGAKL